MRSGTARTRARRTPRKVDRRTVLVLAGAILAAGLAGAQALVQVTQQTRSGLALAVRPGNPVALAARADQRWIENAAKPGNREAASLAQQSLDGQLYNPRALHVLGFQAEADGHKDRARALVALSDRMYRRDMMVQLWEIEDSVNAGRIDQALVHYDTALRTNRNAGQILFPVLAGAIADPAIRRSLAPYIRTGAPWIVPFVRYTIETGTNVPIMARMLVRYGQVKASSLQTQLLGSLVSTGAFAEAERFYLAMPGARPAGLHSTGFDPIDVDPKFVPVAWQAGLAPDSSVGLETGGGAGRRFRISLPVEGSGVVLQKILWLKPGTYRLASEQQFVARGRDAIARWTVDCLQVPAASRRIGDIDAAVARSAGTFTVPADCPVQSVALSVDGGSNEAGLEMLVDRVRLLPGR